ncbi:hypothetical protein niasHS_017491 [Heterodera schachtii]|uniref:Polyprotein allergen nematode domain-containing protein n=1 Tax=Heterodera schachtii TaxID=97005 RepID=A0ABD2HX88_HETSC
MPSLRICPFNFPTNSLLISVLLLLFCLQFFPLNALHHSVFVRRDLSRPAPDDGVASASINTEEDLGGLNTEWLTDDQLSELASAGNNEERMIKMRTFYDNLEGEAKKGATKKIVEECYGWVDEVATEDERNALKQMHHQSHDECKAKVKELMGRLSEERSEQVEKRMGFCEHVYYGKMDGEGDGGAGTAGDEHHHHHHHHSKRRAHRQRRDHHHHHDHHGEHGLEDYFKTHLAWLTDEQKTEISRMKESGKSRQEIKQKVIELYDATTGEAREKATELLKGGCRELIKIVLGEEKAGKIKEMKESGTDVAKISEQINAWIEELADEKNKELANEYRQVCVRVFGVKGQSGGRRRRSWHGRRHNLQQRNDVQKEEEEEEGEVRLEDEGRAEEAYEMEGEHLRHHNSWLSRTQKQMLKKLRDRGHEDHEIHEQIHEFYEVSPEEVKATARGILQRGCESIFKRIFGEYKAEEIIQMRDEGASNGEIEEKITEALNQIRSPQKRQEAGRFAMSCRRIFAMIERRRRSADNAEHSLEQLFKSHLIWLNEQQREELKQMKGSGKGRTELQQRVMEWYGQLEGQEKQKAREHLRDGCRDILAQVLGKEKADQLKQLREGGMSGTELEAKANEMVDQIQEEEKKAKAKEFGTVCRKILLEGSD